MKLVRNIRVIVWVGFVLITVALFMNSMIFKKSKIIVTFVSEDSPCKDFISEGSVIYEVNGIVIKKPDDFIQVTKGLEGIVTFIIDGNPRSCIIPTNSSLNVVVKKTESRWLKIGVDLEGGTRFLLNSGKNNSIEQNIGKIESRLEDYEITNVIVEKVGDQIQIIVGPENEVEIKEIIGPGIFEAKLTETIDFANKKGELVLGNESYEVVLEDNVIEVNNSQYEVGQSFVLDGIGFGVENISVNTTTLSIDVFDDRDVTEVLVENNYGRILKQDSGYVFMFTVKLSEEGGKKFAKATKGQEVIIDPQSGETFLKNPLVLFVDDEAVLNLPIRGVDAGEEKVDLIIWGYRTTIEEARDDMLKMTSVLKTKRLPNLEIVKRDSISNLWGEKFVSSVSLAVITTSVGTSIFGLVKYRKLKIAAIMFFVTISEVILILGVASSQFFASIVLLTGIVLSGIKDVRGWYSWLTLFLLFLVGFSAIITKWILDTPAMGGLILVVLVGVTQTIISTNQFLERKEVSTKYRVVSENMWKSAFIVTLIMFPLFFFDATKGLAMMTITGVMIGTTISKPGYFYLIETFKSKI